MTAELKRRIDASRARMLGVLERLHAERDPECRVWEHWTIPAFGGERMAVEAAVCTTSSSAAGKGTIDEHRHAP